MHVSIHARTRVRDDQFDLNPITVVSSHARTRVRTTPGDTHRRLVFQSTPARVRTTSPILWHPGMPMVSIHARTRRATFDVRDAPRLEPGFNPRPHACGRHDQKRDGPDQREFQSTPAHACGRPLLPVGKSCVKRCFNPRPHAAGDGGVSVVLDQKAFSIHARTRVRTTSPQHVRTPREPKFSIHARTRVRDDTTGVA